MSRVRSPGANRPRYRVRELTAADLKNGFLETLANLGDVGGLAPAEARGLFKAMKSNHVYHPFVAVADDGQIIGATTLLVEQKFIHSGGLVGHIEDVVVRKGHEGRGVGGSVVKAAVDKGREIGCYKVILDCRPELVDFYKKLGFREHEVGMRIDLARPSPSGARTRR